MWVEFIDESHHLGEDDVLTFGRSGDLIVDADNPYMHRAVGSFLRHEQGWWLRNDGRQIVLTIVDEAGTQVTLRPGGAQLLTSGGTVGFEAGISRYEVEFRLGDDIAPVPSLLQATALDGPDLTKDFARLRLNEEQRAMLALLCESRLRDPGASRHELPSNAEIAQRLGWTLRKFDRKLDYVCRRLAEHGLRGVRGAVGEEAADRREIVAHHLVASGQITLADVERLDDI